MRVHVVIGNEACDMDSMISSLVLSWYLSCVFPEETGNIFLPIMNCKRGEMKLRGEAAYTFKQAGVDTTLLLFKEDISLPLLSSYGELALILVDHNALQSDLSHLGENVVAVVDHHEDQGLYERTKGNRIISPQGSCTSLIGDLILRNAPGLLSPEEQGKREIDCKRNEVSTQVAVVTMMYHVLLLDTSCMSPVIAKAKEIDVAVYSKYRALLEELTFEELKRRRADLSQLSVMDLLMRDTKFGSSLRYPHFVASIPGSLLDLCKKDSWFLPLIETYAREKDMRFVVVMTARQEDRVFKREIMIAVCKDGKRPPADGLLKDEQLFSALKSGLEEATKTLDVHEEEGLLPANVRAIPHNMLVATYVQRNVTGSRKQVVPVLDALLAKL
jgi:exopolyphosphatase